MFVDCFSFTVKKTKLFLAPTLIYIFLEEIKVYLTITSMSIYLLLYKHSVGAFRTLNIYILTRLPIGSIIFSQAFS